MNCPAQNLTLVMKSTQIQERVTKVGHEQYRYELLDGTRFVALPKIIGLGSLFQHLTIDFGVTSIQVPNSPDYLTFCESKDVELSIEQIKTGKAKKFTDVHAFLKELKQ